MNKEVYVYGNKGIANEIVELLQARGEKVLGFILDEKYIIEGKNDNGDIPIISYEKFIIDKEKREKTIIISLGEPKFRKQISNKLKEEGLIEKGINLGDFVSETAEVGIGTIIHYGSFISNNSVIGNSCLINKMSIIGHEAKIGDYVVVSPRVTIGGKVEIGDNSFIGLGALIRDRISIGKNCIIGMGAVVTKNVDDNMVVAGNPAKLIRMNEDGQVFKRT